MCSTHVCAQAPYLLYQGPKRALALAETGHPVRQHAGLAHQLVGCVIVLVCLHPHAPTLLVLALGLGLQRLVAL